MKNSRRVQKLATSVIGTKCGIEKEVSFGQDSLTRWSSVEIAVNEWCSVYEHGEEIFQVSKSLISFLRFLRLANVKIRDISLVVDLLKFAGPRNCFVLTADTISVFEHLKLLPDRGLPVFENGCLVFHWNNGNTGKIERVKIGHEYEFTVVVVADGIVMHFE